jgi:hypothetical protein
MTDSLLWSTKLEENSNELQYKPFFHKKQQIPAIFIISLRAHVPDTVLQGLFPSGLPAIATAAVLGILINAIFLIFKPAVTETEVLDKAMASAD